MNIVHPPYTTNEFWYNAIDVAKVTAPAWQPLESLHPCDLQSSMLKGCTPSNLTAGGRRFYLDASKREVRRVYFAMIAEFDAMVGQYMQAVKDAGVWHQTVLIVTSDHGDMQMEKQQFYKMVPYDGSARVPMVMYDGRQPVTGGRVVTSMTSLIDVFPTIMELAAVPVGMYPSDLDGFSLMPLFAADSRVAAARPTTEAGSPPRQRSGSHPGLHGTQRPGFVVSQFHGDNLGMSWFMVVQNLHGVAYKLIVWGTGREVPSLLFNLDEDVDELHNLIDQRPDVVALLQKSLRSVVDYPAVALQVAATYQAQFKHWRARVSDWQSEIHRPGLRWTSSWDRNSTAAFAAIEAWLSRPPEVLPCRSALQWPPSIASPPAWRG
jgi:hypothetical protein